MLSADASLSVPKAYSETCPNEMSISHGGEFCQEIFFGCRLDVCFCNVTAAQYGVKPYVHISGSLLLWKKLRKKIFRGFASPRSCPGFAVTTFPRGNMKFPLCFHMKCGIDLRDVSKVLTILHLHRNWLKIYVQRIEILLGCILYKIYT